MERLWLKPEAFYPASGIACRTNVRVTAIDREGREAVLADGERIAYEHCVIATGGEARIPPIPGANLPGVQCCARWAKRTGCQQRSRARAP